MREKMDKTRRALQRNPPNGICRTNTLANGTKYIDIGNVEELLNSIFKHWDIEEMEVLNSANGVIVSLKLVVTSYEGWKKTLWGIAGKGYMLKAGALTNDFSAMYKNSIELAPAIARSEALKNACKGLGRLFGSHLNREKTFEVNDFLQKKEDKYITSTNILLENIKKCRDISALNTLILQLTDEDMNNIDILKSIENRKNQFKQLN